MLLQSFAACAASPEPLAALAHPWLDGGMEAKRRDVIAQEAQIQDLL
jgi:hypothetical protein